MMRDPHYEPTQFYAKGQRVVYLGRVYEALSPIMPGLLGGTPGLLMPGEPVLWRDKGPVSVNKATMAQAIDERIGRGA